MRRTDCHDAIKQVTSSYETAVRTVNVVIGIVVRQPDYLKNDDLSLVELRLLAGELHDIYFTRMFASFESSLRHYWPTRIRKTKPSTQVLLSSIANRLGVPQDTLDMVQEVREFRNHLVHNQHDVARRISIDEASRHLNRFLARLPLEW